MQTSSSSMKQVTQYLAITAALISPLLAHAQNSGDTALSQTPLFVSESFPPLNMLVMGRDHKLYYEAYNDASDLNGDGVIDVGYKPDQIDYYGYFNNNVCYTYSGNKGDAWNLPPTTGLFIPASAATGSNQKQCSNAWSGDFLNYLTTSRMDALRKVLYGGMRSVDTVDSTVLQGAYVPRDAHSWGKSYDPLRDGAIYDIRNYAPLKQPAKGTRHLFAVTTLGESGDSLVPQLRVLNDSTFQVWDWVSKEGTAGQGQCMGGVNCEKDAGSQYTIVPASAYRNLSITTWKTSSPSQANMPSSSTAMDTLFSSTGRRNSANQCGTGNISLIDTSGSDNNPFTGASANGCGHDNYMTEITGQIYIPEPGKYTFSIDGDDAVEARLDGTTWGWYNGHGNDRNNWENNSRNREINFTSAGWKDIRFRHVEGSGGDNWGFAQKIERPASKIVGHNIKVQVCPKSNASLREDSCKAYPNDGHNTIYKPTGLLHDFGENEKMYFGLLTGSYQKNLAGGVLRRNMGSFTDEVNLLTGEFKTSINGIVDNINRQRIIGFNGSQYNECGWYTAGPLSEKSNPSDCAMWGNPIAEMMFETLRYFSGATTASDTFDYQNNNSKDKKNLDLSKPAWASPYKNENQGGGGFPHCARPVMTVLSDINPSYDYKLPGSRFSNIDANATNLSGFNVSTETRAIGAAESINGKYFFIGQSTEDNADAAPSVKQINDLSWVRGLSPQEPSKQGTYYSAGVARYGANNRIAGNNQGMNKVMTYSVAIASPLPEIRFPVGDGRYVTIAPFAKSVTGNSINPVKFAPTDQIVDYYVDRIANTGETDKDPTINQGRPYAEFRINYEDVEQGADHDMDAISRYVVALQANGTVKVDIVSEYAAGGIGQHMGYVISGTTKDGMYLEVRDKDTNSVFYEYNTPQGRDPGYCKGRNSDSACITLPLTASRVFTPSTSSESGSFLKDPLWYAAKYGMPDRDPASVVGDPDNYFLVTNATTLKSQMTKAFNDILQNTSSVTSVEVNLPEGPLSGDSEVYRTTFEAEGWSGDLLKEELTVADGSLSRSKIWSAAEQLAGRTDRNILFAGQSISGAAELKPFTWTTINQAANNNPYAAWVTALNRNVDGATDNSGEDRVAFLRGENNSLRERKKLSNGAINLLGDIVNSSALRVKGPAYLIAPANKLEGEGSDYATYAANQAELPEMVYVGSNDGMFHAFNGSTGAEVFAFVPTSTRNYLSVLTASDYGQPEGTPHRYFVDGPSIATDVYFDNVWHKVLIGSLGAGGRQVFALDITNPESPNLLWEFGSDQDSDMGYSLAKPTIARLNDVVSEEGEVIEKGRWVALIPNGYQSGSSSTGQAHLFVLDIANGDVIKEFAVDGIQGVTDAQRPDGYMPLGNGLSSISAIDENKDGQIDLVYGGDLLGNVWRFDVRSATATNWQAQKFFVAQDANSKRLPITAAPYVVDHPLGKGSIVVVGTGRYVTPSDQDRGQQTIFGIWDRYSDGSLVTTGALPSANKVRANLQQQTFTEFQGQDGAFQLTSNAIEWFADNKTEGSDADVQKWGWYIDLPRTEEQLVYDMTLYGQALLFTTIRISEDPCSAGLSGALYAIAPDSGGSTQFSVFDVNGDGKIDQDDLINDIFVSGIDASAGRQQVSGEYIYDPSASRRLISSGIEYGRQSWREQPPNSEE
ncbi:fimbrial assembly protein [Lampropedia puyangensis]|uniref:Fimbrial assembly protein n=1 Tax=Lampropedia puyangensis TaxID=1330072 RepID=A0A4S8FC97_9BURK|nr:PilC/PilY family type IV pilus protein [Lampropedia puyangensis]THU05243.1 fimbrial assembly protein [Lampropedia puyangensis]